MKNNKKWFVKIFSCLLIVFTFFVMHVSAETHVAEDKGAKPCDYLANGAVYQANKPAGIWGTAADGTTITAQLYSRSTMIAESSVTASNGEWKLALPGQEGSYTTYSIRLLENGTKMAEYSDILFGEVWLSAGQSNMQLQLYNSYGGVEMMKTADDTYLRVFQAVSKPEISGGISSPAEDIEGEWIMGDSSDVGSVSAVAYNFAVGLRSELDVPIAILETSLGSTPIEAWISKEMVNTNPKLYTELQFLGVYETEALDYSDMGAMYYSKIAPLSKTGIAGVIWYQGESNASRASIYAMQLDLLKEKWGEAFGFENDTMPFVFTQLAPYSFAKSSDQMLLTEMMDQMSEFYREHETTVAMITNYDLSLQYTDTLKGTVQAVIHPTVKKPIGERMVLAAMGLVYGGKEATAPTLLSCEIIDGIAVLKFSHVGEGLKLIDESLDALGFALCDANGVWVNATAEIINRNTVFVYSSLMQNPLYVSYAYCDMNTDANLCASNGIPAAPFSTNSNSGFGSRSYLNCDEEVFVVTSYETVNKEVGHAEYQSLWTFVNRSKISFDNSYCEQGTASVKVDYEAGMNEVIAGIDLREANQYSVTDGLKGIKMLCVKMSNAENRDKEIRLSLITTDSITVFSEAQTLKAKADFDTLIFDLTRLYYENGAMVPYPAKICENMAAICFYIGDVKKGTVWIDDIKLGVDNYWEPDLQSLMNKLGIQKEYASVVNKEGKNEMNVDIVGVVVAAVVLIIVISTICVVTKRKKNAISN